MTGQDWAFAGIVVGAADRSPRSSARSIKRQPHLGLNAAAVETFNGRVRAWWIICSLLAVAFLSSGLTVALFGFMSFWALREFITLTPTRLGDHRALFWVFFFFTPLQYVLVWLRQVRALQHFDSGLRVSVHSGPHRAGRRLQAVSGARGQDSIGAVDLRLLPELRAGAAVSADIPGEDSRGNARLLFFFVTMALFSEALQFVWSQLYGRHVIAPSINAARTWEGLIGGTASAALAGIVLYWATPFHDVWQAAFMSMVIAVMGFAGAMTMSAIKRDRGVRDYGTLVEGHGGVLDRIDAICFAAPVFYQVTRQMLGHRVADRSTASAATCRAAARHRKRCARRSPRSAAALDSLRPGRHRRVDRAARPCRLAATTGRRSACSRIGVMSSSGLWPRTIGCGRARPACAIASPAPA